MARNGVQELAAAEKSGTRLPNGHADERLNFQDVTKSRSNQRVRESAKFK